MKTVKDVIGKYKEVRNAYDIIIDRLENNLDGELLESLCDEITCPLNDEDICVAYSVDQQMSMKSCVKYRGY